MNMTVNAGLEELVCHENFEHEYTRVVNLTSLSVKTFAYSFTKEQAFLDKGDIDKIKNALNNYVNDNEKVNSFKNELIEDLNQFQKGIESKHAKQIAEYKNQKQIYENEMRTVWTERDNLATTGFSKIFGNNNSKLKEYESKLILLRSKIAQLNQRIQELEKSLPIANEKDILMYQMHLKEKYLIKK